MDCRTGEIMPEGEMIAVGKELLVCEKHYYSHYGEFTDCPCCRAEKAEAEIAELREVALALREWIDAVPDDIPLPTMPGVDRDWVDEVLARTEAGYEAGKQGEAHNGKGCLGPGCIYCDEEEEEMRLTNGMEVDKWR